MDGKELARKTWGSSPTGWTAARGYDPGTREFFETALRARRSHEMAWLPEVIPFHETRRKQVLEIGFGPGYDALTFLESGAHYSGIDITPENVERTKKHLGFFGYSPDVRQGDAEALPFKEASFDFVFSNGVLHHVPDISRAISEAARVLRPGGSAYLVLYHRNSIFYRVNLGLWQHLMLGGFRHQSLTDRLRAIEANAAGVRPMVRVYSRAEAEDLLQAAGLVEVRSAVRKLVWEDLPGIPLLYRLYRHIPQPLLDAVGRRAGWYVIVSGQKPNTDGTT